MSKLRTSIDTFLKSDSTTHAKLDHLTLMEMATIRPLLPHALDQILRISNTVQVCKFHYSFIKNAHILSLQQSRQISFSDPRDRRHTSIFSGVKSKVVYYIFVTLENKRSPFLCTFIHLIRTFSH